MSTAWKNNVQRFGYGRDENGNWHIELGVRDPGGRWTKRTFSMAALATDQNVLWRFLGAAGYVLSSPEKKQFHKALLTSPGKADFSVATSVGWHGTAFITPYRIYGDPRDQLRFEHSVVIDEAKWTPKGSSPVWRREIGGICDGNPLLRFAVMTPFAGPLLHLLRRPTVGISWVGDPSQGKSIALALAGSVCGGGDKLLGFCETLLKTANSYDKVAQRYRHCFLALDEAHLAAPQHLADMVHRLAAGETKETAISDSLPVHGSLLYMITANQRLEEILRANGIAFDDSYTARLLEVEVPSPQGLFDRLPDGLTPDEFGEQILATIAEQYGTAIDGYLTELTADHARDARDLVSWLRKRMKWMARELGIDGNVPGEARRGQYFCLIYAAGYLARKYGVLPWSWRESAEAVQVAYEAHKQLVPKTVKRLATVAEVRRYIEKHRHDFIDVRHRLVSYRDFSACPGFIVHTRVGGTQFAVLPNQFRAVFKSRADDLLQALKKAELLRHDHGKWTAKREIRKNRGRDRVYCIDTAILGSTRLKVSAR